MDYSSIDTIHLGWYIVYIEALQVILNKYCISFSEARFDLANSVNPDEMPHNAAFHEAFTVN